jgi:hypothetical protein
MNYIIIIIKKILYDPLRKIFQSTPKCHILTLEVLKVNIFRFKMQNDPIWAYNQMANKSSAPQKKAQNRRLGNYKVYPNSGN